MNTTPLRKATDVLDWYTVPGAQRNGSQVWTAYVPKLGNVYVLAQRRPNLGLDNRKQLEYLVRNVQSAYDAAS